MYFVFCNLEIINFLKLNVFNIIILYKRFYLIKKKLEFFICFFIIK